MRRVKVAVMAVVLVATFCLGAYAAQKEITFLDVSTPVPALNYVTSIVIPEFEQKYNCKVNVITTDWNGRMDKISVMHAAGTPPDVVVTAFYTPYEEGSRGLLEPLDRYVANWPAARNYPKPLLDAQRWDGKLMAIPNNLDFRVIAYNKEIFAQSGYDPNRPPQSWDEQYEYTKRMTRLEGNRVSIRGFELWGISSQIFNWFLRQAGMREVNIDTFTSNLTTKEAFDTLEHLLSLYDATQARMGHMGGYAAGRSAMWIGQPSTSRTLKESNPELLPHLGTFAPRRYPDSKPVAYAYINGLAMTAASKEKDLAWAFIAHMNEDKHVLKIMELAGWIAGRADLVREMMQVQPRIELWYQQFDYLEATLIPPPRNIAQNEVDARLKRVYDMQLAPQAALEQCHDIWNQLLATWKSEIGAIRK